MRCQVKWLRVRWSDESAGDLLKFSMNYELILWYYFSPLSVIREEKRMSRKKIRLIGMAQRV
jgi:hypothetical protein